MSDEYEFPLGDARFKELMGRVRATALGQSVSASEWQEIEDYICEEMESAHDQAEYDKGYAAGEESKRESIKFKILAQAAELFTKGEDTEAKKLRALAHEISSTG